MKFWLLCLKSVILTIAKESPLSRGVYVVREEHPSPYCRLRLSSYDYGSAIREDRTLTPKYDEIKLQALFLHASEDLFSTSITFAGVGYTDNSNIYTTHLQGQNGTGFYVFRQNSNKYALFIILCSHTDSIKLYKHANLHSNCECLELCHYYPSIWKQDNFGWTREQDPCD